MQFFASSLLRASGGKGEGGEKGGDRPREALSVVTSFVVVYSNYTALRNRTDRKCAGSPSTLLLLFLSLGLSVHSKDEFSSRSKTFGNIRQHERLDIEGTLRCVTPIRDVGAVELYAIPLPSQMIRVNRPEGLGLEIPVDGASLFP